MEQTTTKQRIKDFTRHERISISDFCRAIGVSVSFVSSMRSSMQPDKIDSIALKYPHLSIEWLLTGNGEMIKTDVKSDVLAPASSNMEVEILKARLEEKEETIDKKDRRIEELAGEVQRWKTLVQQSQLTGPAWDLQQPQEKTG